MQFSQSGVAPIDERDYGDVMQAAIERAGWRIWVSMFIFDPRPSRDVVGTVGNLVASIGERFRLGADVRILTAGDLTSPDIVVANLAAGLLLEDQGVPHRRLFDVGQERRGSHAKFAVVDDRAFVGSQNWTDDAFRANTEDAVMMTGSAVSQLAVEFDRLWQLGRGMPTNAY